MTGYGAAAAERDDLKAHVTVRSLNHRFLDLSVHVPRRLAALEPDLRRLVQGRLNRGRVELSVQAATRDLEDQPVLPNRALITALVRALRDVQAEHALPGEVRVVDLMRFPGAFEVQDADAGLEDTRRETLLALVAEALDGLETMRASEGLRLEAALLGALDAIETAAGTIQRLLEQERPRRLEALSARLTALRDELGLDEGRLYQEVVRLVDRQDVTEELQRLGSHVAQAREIVSAGGPCGKRLDFLTQEMGREANTIGGKSDSAPLAQAVVGLKSEIEKLREQVQNVE